MKYFLGVITRFLRVKRDTYLLYAYATQCNIGLYYDGVIYGNGSAVKTRS